MNGGINDRATFSLSQGSSLAGASRLIAGYARDIRSGRDLPATWMLGVGVVDGDATAVAGLALGRNLQVAVHAGWIVADTKVELRRDALLAKTELTLGLTLPQGTKLYAQALGETDLTDSARKLGLPLAAGGPPVPTTLRLGLNAAIPLRDGLHLDMGLSQGVLSSLTSRARIGIWLAF